MQNQPRQPMGCCHHRARPRSRRHRPISTRQYGPRIKKSVGSVLPGDPATDARAKLNFPASAVVGKHYLRCLGCPFSVAAIFPIALTQELAGSGDAAIISDEHSLRNVRPVTPKNSPPGRRAEITELDKRQPGEQVSKRASHRRGTFQWIANGPPQVPMSPHYSVAATWASVCTLH
jgi:hypothetical protein